MIRRRKDSEKPGKRTIVRPFWSGTISFGLINVPVQLFPANRRNRVSLRMLDDDGTPLRRRYRCPLDDRLIESDEIVRGFPLDDGRHVIVTDEDLQAIEPRKTREIDLRRFVQLSEISPLHFDRAYFLTPSGDTNKAYRLLADVMERTGRAGIASFVMRGKEYLVAILAEDGILRAATLRFEEELRSADDVGLPEPDDPDEEAVARFEQEIEEHEAAELDPEELTDDYSERLRALAEEKRRRGQDVVEAYPAEESEEEEAADPGDEDEVPEVDLLETIRISLRGEGASGGNGGGRGDRGGRGEGERRSGGDREIGALENLPKTELYERAQNLDIEGRSKMTKDTLVREIRRRWRR